MRRALVLFSGGADSTLALAWALHRGYAVTTLEFDYPGRPRGEIRAAGRIARVLKVRDRLRVRLPFHAARSKSSRDGYIPGRNLAFHAVAQAVAESRKAHVVVAGHLRHDAHRFRDAGPRYLSEIAFLARRGRLDRRLIRVILPAARLGAKHSRRLRNRLKAPLALSWSCWRDGPAPCGRCEKCRERLIAGL